MLCHLLGFIQTEIIIVGPKTVAHAGLACFTEVRVRPERIGGINSFFFVLHLVS